MENDIVSSFLEAAMQIRQIVRDIRKVEKVSGGLYGVEFDRFADQKAPGK